ncbi:MAG: hypothetical protein ACKO40_02860 [Planctomycetaceae bacterium]
MDLSLFVTIGLIFMVTSLAGYLRSRITDRCLRSFDGFNVTLQKADGKRVWGRMGLCSGGMEFTFPKREGSDAAKTSYLLYAAEYKLVQAILRYADRLTDAERSRRDADIVRSFHPGAARRLARRLRNFLGSATDSLRDVLALVMGRVQKMQDRYVAAEGADTLTKLGGSVLTEVSSTHDPLLEGHVGQRVVVEVIEGDELHEHAGIFKEYSAMFLHLLDVEYPDAWSLDVGPAGTVASDNIVATMDDTSLKVANAGDRPVLILTVEAGDVERNVDAIVAARGSVTLPVSGPDRMRLRLQTVRDVDMIVPRSRATVRHRAERTSADGEPESTWDVVFDLGTLIHRRADDEQTEARLRRELEADPAAAAAAAALGAELLKREDFAEAGRWLRVAYNGRDTLPDEGRRVRMQLRELARRLAQRGSEPPLPLPEPTKATTRPHRTTEVSID